MLHKIKSSKHRGAQSNLTLIAVIVVIVIGLSYLIFSNQNPQSNDDQEQNGVTEPNIPSFSINLIGEDGSSHTIGPEEISDMTKLEMEGGLMTSTGVLKGPYSYTGIPLNDVLELVGGTTENNSLRVTADDGYAMVFTWDELNGDFLTFDPATGDETTAKMGLTPVLAYHEDGEELPEGHGPIRLVILGEEGLITEGHFWIKQVVEIQVIAAIQEYTLTLNGTIFEVMDRATFESGTKCPDTTPNHRGVYEDDEGNIYTGIPLWLLIGRIDDNVTHQVNAYNRDMADANVYTIHVIASDGYAAELNSSFVKLNENIILANEMNGVALPEKYWPLKLVGSDLTSNQMVRNIEEIRLVFNQSYDPEDKLISDVDVPEFELNLVGEFTEVMDKETFLTGAECEEMQHMYSWTDGNGDEWTGIPVWLLVGRVDDDNPHGPDAFNRDLASEGYQVSFIASDEYHKELDSSLIAENNQILIAYLMNGEALPEDKAPLKLVGEGLTSGQMVSMLETIEIIFPE